MIEFDDSVLISIAITGQGVEFGISIFKRTAYQKPILSLCKVKIVVSCK